jgi:uncharacterized membrane protein
VLLLMTGIIVATKLLLLLMVLLLQMLLLNTTLTLVHLPTLNLSKSNEDSLYYTRSSNYVNRAEFSIHEFLYSMGISILVIMKATILAHDYNTRHFVDHSVMQMQKRPNI